MSHLSTFQTIFTMTFVTLFLIVLGVGIGKGLKWLGEKIFGPKDDYYL